MKFFDSKFTENKLHYIVQCLLATLAIFIVLLLLDFISDGAVIAAFGASSFILFLMPKVKSSSPRYLIGSYFVGVAIGCLCHYLSLIPILDDIKIITDNITIIFGALAVGITMFIMVIVDVEHPPAAGLALGLVFDGFNHTTVIVAIVGIITLVIIKELLKKYMINLL